MNYNTSLFSRTSISIPKKKLTIKTLNTEFDINENVEETYYKLLKYCINDTKAINNYKTTIVLNELGNIKQFSTFSKII